MRYGFVLAMLALMVVVTGCCCPLLGRKGPRAGEGWIAFASYRGNDGLNIYVMRGDGSEAQQLTHGLEGGWEPAWSSDGKQIAFTSLTDRRNSDIYVMNTNGSERRQLTSSPKDDRSPAWSPDGKQIAFASNRDGDFEIYVMNADGSEQRRLTDSPGYDADPAWSPDGARIAFASRRDGGGIYVMEADGSEPVRLTSKAGVQPAWSPDGSRLAFSHDGSICVIGADGQEERCARHKMWEASYPSWSPNGAWIAFQLEPGPQIWVMRTDGTGWTRLGRGWLRPLPDLDQNPAWGLSKAYEWSGGGR